MVNNDDLMISSNAEKANLIADVLEEQFKPNPLSIANKSASDKAITLIERENITLDPEEVFTPNEITPNEC